MKIENKLLAELKPATYNPRQITTKQYNDLKESIEKFGIVDPIIINKDNTIIGGHQRYKIFRDITNKNSLPNITIPCVVLELNKEQERELNVRLNKNTGEFDMDILANEFNIDELVDWGFKHIDLGLNIDKIIEGNTEDDHIPEVKESRVKLGDVWELGKHRLMCGDSTIESDVKKLMNGQKADMVFTDPPYGMNLDTDYKKMHKKAKTYNKVIGDNVSFNPKFILEYFKDCKEVFLWGADYYCNSIPEDGSWFVWNKRSTDDIKKQDFNSDLQKKVIGNAFELCWSKQRHKKTILHCFWNGSLGAGEDEERTKSATIIRYHPTQKPIKVCKEIITPYIKENQLVVDLFLGSGSTLIACEKTNRVCYGMELDTKYCDVIIERWEQFTGQKATKL